MRSTPAVAGFLGPTASRFHVNSTRAVSGFKIYPKALRTHNFEAFGSKDHII